MDVLAHSARTRDAHISLDLSEASQGRWCLWVLSSLWLRRMLTVTGMQEKQWLRMEGCRWLAAAV